MIVAVVMKFCNTVADKFFKLSFVLYSTINVHFCLKIIVSVKFHFIDESLIGNGKAVVFQIAYFPDVRLLVICLVVGDFDGTEVLFFQAIADNTFKITADKKMLMVYIDVDYIAGADTQSGTVKNLAFSVLSMVNDKSVVPICQVEGSSLAV